MKIMSQTANQNNHETHLSEWVTLLESENLSQPNKCNLVDLF